MVSDGPTARAAVWLRRAAIQTRWWNISSFGARSQCRDAPGVYNVGLHDLHLYTRLRWHLIERVANRHCWIGRP